MCKEIQKNKNQHISIEATTHEDGQMVQKDLMNQNHVEQQMPDQLERDLEAIHKEDSSIEDEQLVQVSPVLANSIISKQFDPNLMKQSKTKSGRKQAATNQKKADHLFAASVQSKINSMADTVGRLNSVGSEVTVQRAFLEGISATFKALPERKDITGHSRRKNAKKYEGSGATTRRAREAAREDVDNLVNNLHRDLCMEEDISIPNKMQKFVDAYYFTYRFGEKAIEKKTSELKKQRAEGTLTEEEIQKAKDENGNLSEMVLWVKSCGSGFIVNLKKMERELQAMKLTRQQLDCEGPSAYHKLMIQLLDEDIETKQENYKKFVKGILDVSGKKETRQGQAQLKIVEELSALRRRMQEKDTTEEERQRCEEQAKSIIENFKWEEKSSQ